MGRIERDRHALLHSRRALLGVPLGALAVGLAARALGAPAASVVELELATDGDLLAFKPDALSCPAGAPVHLRFRHAGRYITQAHNWVLVQPGSADAVARAGLAAGEGRGFVAPHDPQVLAATPLCPKGGVVELRFVAPAPGDYPFLCTSPGHSAVMRGVLHVLRAMPAPS